MSKLYRFWVGYIHSDGVYRAYDVASLTTALRIWSHLKSKGKSPMMGCEYDGDLSGVPRIY